LGENLLALTWATSKVRLKRGAMENFAGHKKFLVGKKDFRVQPDRFRCLTFKTSDLLLLFIF
jgi:hypothetical protein